MGNYLLFNCLFKPYSQSVFNSCLTKAAMRTYPRNSPEAAARVVALVLTADGHFSGSEYEALRQCYGARDLGLAPDDMPGIVQTLCEDLLMEGFDGRSILTHMGDCQMTSLLDEVDDLQLQGQVLRVAATIVHADKHLSEDETAMLTAICRHWRSCPVTGAAVAAELSHPAPKRVGSI